MPLLLVIIGAWLNWDRPWVRYLTGLGILAYFYTWGAFSFLHGLSYVLVPYLWMAREAGRFIYLTHFAMAVLAGFGVQTLFFGDSSASESFLALARILKWIVVAFAAVVTVPVLFGKFEINEWTYFTFLFLLGAYGLFLFVTRGRRTLATQVLLVALIVCDLNGTHWIMRNRRQEQNAGTDHLAKLMDCRNVATFLKSQPGLFRVHTEADPEPNIGDVYGIQTTGGWTATWLTDYARFKGTIPRAMDLLNVRFVLKQKVDGAAAPVYQDGTWYVYEKPSYCPRGWIVHEVAIEASFEGVRRRMEEPGFDPLRRAIIQDTLDEPLAPHGTDSSESITFNRYGLDRLDLTVRSQGRGLLVLSEVDYTGWQATVNGQPARIHRVNGLLRGVVVPRGESRVTFRYAPRSVWIGAALTLSTLLGIMAFTTVLVIRKKDVQQKPWNREKRRSANL